VLLGKETRRVKCAIRDACLFREGRKEAREERGRCRWWELLENVNVFTLCSTGTDSVGEALRRLAALTLCVTGASTLLVESPLRKFGVLSYRDEIKGTGTVHERRQWRAMVVNYTGMLLIPQIVQWREKDTSQQK